MKAVVDASFLLALLPGDRDRGVLAAAYPALRERLQLVAPHLLVLESGNVIHGRRRDAYGGTLPERRSLHRELLRGVAVTADPDEERLEVAAALAEEHALSLYDATYLALAAVTPGSVLLSNDGDLLAAAKAALGPGRVYSAQDAARAFADSP